MRFTKNISGKYIKVAYNSPADKLTSTLLMNSTQLCLSEIDADKFIEKVKDLQGLISEKIKAQNLNYNVELILLTYFNVIESISSGFDIRSKYSNEELSDIIIEGYGKKFLDALKFCEKTIKKYEDGEKNEPYTKHWRDYDKHNDFVDEYQFDLIKFKDTDFKINLESINKSASELLELLIKENANKNKL